ncbi:hypothetical protein GCM10020367_63570 [Streptomyces sannanensis]|uniref:Uncharacterized protein n=1 Tax=Streptomyces sannanensis TaxID=285536 RepID=A0ABP6SKY1_9ACTN
MGSVNSGEHRDGWGGSSDRVVVEVAGDVGSRSAGDPGEEGREELMRLREEAERVQAALDAANDVSLAP